MSFSIHEGTFQMINSSPTNFLILMFFKGYEMGTFHSVKSVRIRSYSGQYFLSFGLNTRIINFSHSIRMWENVNQNNSEYGHFSCSVGQKWVKSKS